MIVNAKRFAELCADFKDTWSQMGCALAKDSEGIRAVQDQKDRRKKCKSVGSSQRV